MMNFVPMNNKKVVRSNTVVKTSRDTVATHAPGCACHACRGIMKFDYSTHRTRSMPTLLYADATETEVPAEVEAMDGVESNDEAHNVERPARAALKKKKPAGKDLSEFSEGSTVKGTVKSLASYGAFVDIGASCSALRLR